MYTFRAFVDTSDLVSLFGVVSMKNLRLETQPPYYWEVQITAKKVQNLKLSFNFIDSINFLFRFLFILV